MVVLHIRHLSNRVNKGEVPSGCWYDGRRVVLLQLLNRKCVAGYRLEPVGGSLSFHGDLFHGPLAILDGEVTLSDPHSGRCDLHQFVLLDELQP